MHLARVCATSSSLSSSSVRSLRALVSWDSFSLVCGCCWGFGPPRRRSDHSLQQVLLGRRSGVQDWAACAEKKKKKNKTLGIVQWMMSLKNDVAEGLANDEGGSSLAMSGGVGCGPQVKSPDGAGERRGGEAAAAGGDGGEDKKRPMEEEKKKKKRRREGEWFPLTDSCSLVLHQGDITKWSVDGETDAIVNAANEAMLGGGGVDGAIHRAAGPKLLEACYAVPQVRRGVRCPTGSAVITEGFDLPASKVIHTVGPIYESDEISAERLAKAYRSSMAVANKASVKYIAFPAISCGVYGYPYKEAAKIALEAVQETSAGLLEVHFVLFHEHMWKVWLAEAERCLERENTIDV